jgi:hypothetical protein
LGKKFFKKIDAGVVERLLHEYSRENVSDHLSYKFADEIARLGVKLAIHLAKKPNSKINLFLAEG